MSTFHKKRTFSGRTYYQHIYCNVFFNLPLVISHCVIVQCSVQWLQFLYRLKKYPSWRKKLRLRKIKRGIYLLIRTVMDADRTVSRVIEALESSPCTGLSLASLWPHNGHIQTRLVYAKAAFRHCDFLRQLRPESYTNGAGLQVLVAKRFWFNLRPVLPCSSLFFPGIDANSFNKKH
jgi:hypothetical protein